MYKKDNYNKNVYIINMLYNSKYYYYIKTTKVIIRFKQIDKNKISEVNYNLL